MTVLSALFGYFTFLFKRVEIKVCCQNGHECLQKHLSVWQIDWKKVLYLFSYFLGWLGHFKELLIPILHQIYRAKTSDDIMTNRRLRVFLSKSIFCFCCVLFSSREMEDV